MKTIAVAAFSAFFAACGGAPFEPGPLREAVTAPEAGDEAPDPPPDDGGLQEDGPSGHDAHADGEGARHDGAVSDAGVDAASDAPSPPPPVCVTDLSGIGTGDFAISFRMTTTATVATALLHQRAACGDGMMWDVRMKPGGVIYVETDDGTSAGYASLLSIATVNDGATHDVTIARAADTLSIAIDGVASGAVADSDALATLPALQIGADPCADTSPLSGTLTNVCLTRGN